MGMLPGARFISEALSLLMLMLPMMLPVMSHLISLDMAETDVTFQRFLHIGEELGRWRAHRQHVACLATDESGTTSFLSGGEDGRAKVWDLRTKQVSHML